MTNLSTQSCGMAQHREHYGVVVMRLRRDPRRTAVDVRACIAHQVAKVLPSRLPVRLFAVALGSLALSGCDVPLPDSAMLKPQPPPKCEARKQPDEGGDAASKLDYQVQCYRHAEMIARNRLGKLQDSVRETVKAVKPGPGGNKPGSGGNP